MNPGKLRQRITFLKPPGEQNNNGFPTTEWTPYVTVWAAERTLKGRFYYEAASTHKEHNKEFTIRFRNDLSKNMRVQYRGQDYEIEDIINVDGLNKFMTVIVKEVV
jgi:SPP1 family predicted phage head-tail adaptor